MHRLLVDRKLLDDASPILPKEAARHLKVLRPEQGEAIELFDGAGSSRVYAWNGKGLAATAPRTHADPPSPLTLFACVTKGSRWDWTVEKATELGVTRIVPVISDRTIVRIPVAEREAKRGRWVRIAEDASRQSDAKWLPEIVGPVDFKTALELVRETTCFIGALTTPPSPTLAAAVSKAAIDSGKPPAAFIGPEGDFTSEELAALMAIAIPTSFGPTVLRAETAAIFAVSVIKGLGQT